MFFSCIYICWVPRKLFEHEADRLRLIGRVSKHLPRDTASVNAMKPTCVIVILAYFNVVARTLKIIRTSKGDYWIKQ